MPFTDNLLIFSLILWVGYLFLSCMRCNQHTATLSPHSAAALAGNRRTSSRYEAPRLRDMQSHKGDTAAKKLSRDIWNAAQCSECFHEIKFSSSKQKKRQPFLGRMRGVAMLLVVILFCSRFIFEIEKNTKSHWRAVIYESAATAERDARIGEEVLAEGRPTSPNYSD